MLTPTKFPQFRRHIATGLLGMAIAIADTFGVDSEDFLRKLRAEGGKASEMVPPGEPS